MNETISRQIKMIRLMKPLILLLGLILLVACQTPEAVPTAVPVVDAPVSTPVPVAATNTPEPVATDEPDILPYQDPALPIDERVEDLLDRMTLDEKIGQMTLIENGSIRPEGVTEFNLGAILSGGGGSPPENSPQAWLEMVTAYQEAALETRLGIPLLYGVDAVHGHSNVVGATIFPHNIGLGATRNPDLLYEIGRVTAVETLATGIHWDYAPVLAVARDIRWGRTYEAYAEETDLVTLLSNAYLLGLQGVDGSTSDLGHPLTLLGTPKHWVADGGTGWETSTTGSYKIDQGDTILDEETLRAVHIPPYITAVDSGARSMMISYSSWNGLKMHAHDYLINDVLIGEIGFEGFIVSDWQAIDQITSNYYEAVVTSINAGVDLNMVPFDTSGFINAMKRAIRNGDISQERVDQAVTNILTVKMELGLFENPLQDDSLLETVGSDEHRAVARQAVAESLVLLQNDNEALPVSKDVDRIFIGGQYGDDIGLQSGGWTIEWQGASGEITEGTTFLEATEAAVSEETEVYFNRFGKFETVTDENGDPLRADVGFVLLGERPYAEGRGDREDLSINSTMIERMREQADVVVVILVTGRPLIITDELPLADAWVAAWWPGTEGNGITDVLFGDQDFSGKLSFSWPRSMDQIPFNFEEMPTEGCDAPLFPFGYGLTYQNNSPVESLDCN